MSKFCVPTCRLFRCGKNELLRREAPLCRLTDERCRGFACTYASCVRNRLLTSGVCGLTLKRRTKTSDEIPEETLDIKLKSKILRKISKEDIY